MNESSSILAKLGIVGWIGIFVVAMGVLLWLFRPTSWFNLMMFLCVALPIGFMIFWMYHLQSTNAAWEELRRNGIAGTARIVRSESTNVRVDKRPQVRLQLDVHLPGEPPYQVTRSELVPPGHAAGPGQELSVYVDRQDRNRLIVDWSGLPASVPAEPSKSGDVAARLSQLDALRRAGQITQEEYQAQRRRILGDL